MKPLWLSSLLIVNTLIAFLLGWIANRAWVRANRKHGPCVPAAILPPLGESARGCRALLAEIWEDLSLFSEALREFTDSRQLQAECGAASCVPEAGRLREACQRFALVVDDKQQHLQEFADSYREILGSLMQRLNESRRRAGELDAHLTQVESVLSEAFQETLDGMTLELIDENIRLQTELALAHRRIAEQGAQLAAADREVRIDGLTELPNRRAFDEKLVEMMAFRDRCEQSFTLALIDVDHFKSLNDSHGHRAGDLMLQTLARVIRNSKRPIDHVSRYGGEEFAILMPRCSLETAERVMQRYRQSIAAGVLIFQGERLTVTVSTGLAEIREGETAAQLIDRADSALYQAKTAGRDRVWVHNGNMMEPGSQPMETNVATAAV